MRASDRAYDDAQSHRLTSHIDSSTSTSNFDIFDLDTDTSSYLVLSNSISSYACVLQHEIEILRSDEQFASSTSTSTQYPAVRLAAFHFYRIFRSFFLFILVFNIEFIHKIFVYINKIRYFRTISIFRCFRFGTMANPKISGGLFVASVSSDQSRV